MFDQINKISSKNNNIIKISSNQNGNKKRLKIYVDFKKKHFLKLFLIQFQE